MRKLLLLLLFPFILFSQNECDEDICVIQFNAGWNQANSVDWLEKLTDCGTLNIDIATNTEAQEKYEIVVVPTAIGGEKNRPPASSGIEDIIYSIGEGEVIS